MLGGLPANSLAPLKAEVSRSLHRAVGLLRVH